MPFLFNGDRLSEEKRKSVWREGFPIWCVNGFDVYFGSLQQNNMLSMSREAEWWEGTYEYRPSGFVRQWLAANYSEFEEDMKNLAEIMILKKDDYFTCADYLTRLYEEKGAVIRTLVSAEYMHGYLAEIFPDVNQSFAEEVGVLIMDSTWPNNLHQDLLDKDFDSDVEGFWQVLATSIDEFLGFAVRSYRGELDFDDSRRDGGPAGDGGSNVSAIEFC